MDIRTITCPHCGQSFARTRDWIEMRRQKLEDALQRIRDMNQRCRTQGRILPSQEMVLEIACDALDDFGIDPKTWEVKP